MCMMVTNIVVICVAPVRYIKPLCILSVRELHVCYNTLCPEQKLPDTMALIAMGELATDKYMYSSYVHSHTHTHTHTHTLQGVSFMCVLFTCEL